MFSAEASAIPGSPAKTMRRRSSIFQTLRRWSTGSQRMKRASTDSASDSDSEVSSRLTPSRIYDWSNNNNLHRTNYTPCSPTTFAYITTHLAPDQPHNDEAKLESVKQFILHQAQEIPAGADMHICELVSEENRVLAQEQDDFRYANLHRWLVQIKMDIPFSVVLSPDGKQLWFIGEANQLGKFLAALAAKKKIFDESMNADHVIATEEEDGQICF